MAVNSTAKSWQLVGQVFEFPASPFFNLKGVWKKAASCSWSHVQVVEGSWKLRASCHLSDVGIFFPATLELCVCSPFLLLSIAQPFFCSLLSHNLVFEFPTFSLTVTFHFDMEHDVLYRQADSVLVHHEIFFQPRWFILLKLILVFVALATRNIFTPPYKITYPNV